MKTRMLMLTVAVATTTMSCNKAQFGANGGKRAGNAVSPKTGVQTPENEPLDLSKLEINKPQSPSGPQGGDSEVLSKTLEMDCDTSTGIIVDLGEPGTNPGKPDPDFMKLLEESAGLDPDKGNEGPVLIGTDGKPLPTDPNDPGKPGKPGKPLPPQPPIELPEPNKVIAKVKGKFCPTAQSKLTVLFVVDYSGSMGRHFPEPGLPELPGYDPQINNSCGRLRAAEAIVARLKSLAQANDDVRIGMVPFAGGIVTRNVVQIMNYKAFESKVNKDVFCQHIVQDPSFGYEPQNPGGLDGRGGFLGLGTVNASTNYAAAFTAAESLLANAYGRKVVYFISDGEPTSGGPTIPSSIAAGIEAGRRLRESVDNLELNGLLLGNAGPQAKATLEQVAGSPDRVRQADNADQLAAQILAFPDAAINETTGKATLTVEPYRARESLGLTYLRRIGTSAVWEYETQPFVVLGKPGVEVENVVEVTALGIDGTTHQSVVKIRYRQTP